VTSAGAGHTSLAGRFRRWYGARPLHLLALLAAFGLAGYAVHAVIAAGQWRGFAAWFAAAIVAHDLLLFPLYSLADLSLRRLLPRWAAGARAAPPPPAPPVLNHVRIPAAFSLLLLAVFFPLILGLSGAAYHRASGLTTAPYLWRWLAITGLMFTISAVCYALRWRRASLRRPKAASAGPAVPPAGSACAGLPGPNRSGPSLLGGGLPGPGLGRPPGGPGASGSATRP
jgi:hypothetical protein